MATKTEIFEIEEGDLAASATAVKASPVIPPGKRVSLRKFGGAVQMGEGAVALQWGSGAVWETVRVGCGTFEFALMREFIGDGNKRLRLVRVNKSASASRYLAVWVEALLHDAV